MISPARSRRCDLDVRWLDRALAPPFDHGVGHQPADQFVDDVGLDGVAELHAPTGGRGVGADAELARGVPERVGGGVGDAGQERDLDAVAGGEVPAAMLQQGVDEHTVQSVEVAGVEFPVDEDDVGDVDRLRRRNADSVGSCAERHGSGVPVECANGQSMPGGHHCDPTDRATEARADCTKCLRRYP